MSSCVRFSKEIGIPPKFVRDRKGRGCNWIAFGVLAAASMFAVSVTDVQAEELKLTPEFIQKSNPDLYRQIQNGPRLPPPEVDPVKPYDPDPGFFAQPVLKPGQIQEWWENSSYEYSPMYPYLLKSTNLKFSYVNSTGNDDGHSWKGNFMLSLRKDKFTNTISYNIDQKKFKSPDGSISSDKDMQTFEESALYELNPYLFVEAGFVWQRLSIFEIENRYVPMAGVGSYNLLRDVLDKKKYRLTLNLAFANVTDEYTPMVVNFIKKDSDSFKAIYARAEYTHKFNEIFTYKMEGILKHAIDTTPVYSMVVAGGYPIAAIQIGSTKRYDWNWYNSFECAVNQYVGFLVSYNVAFDSNPFPGAAKRDTEYMTGVKFSF